MFRDTGLSTPFSDMGQRFELDGADHARKRILDRLTDLPVQVVDASWHCITSNPLAYALAGDTSALPMRERNLAWTVFT
ncbi:MmyB family transcriptional regulator, partial [Streptomyces brasiliensis]|uniref:MmyB family transcriptional regulator n=1 Tax=Streptomyces brasiliensis TaxID=1954 RepID=UPI0040330FD9